MSNSSRPSCGTVLGTLLVLYSGSTRYNDQTMTTHHSYLPEPPRRVILMNDDSRTALSRIPLPPDHLRRRRVVADGLLSSYSTPSLEGEAEPIQLSLTCERACENELKRRTSYYDTLRGPLPSTWCTALAFLPLPYVPLATQQIEDRAATLKFSCWPQTWPFPSHLLHTLYT